MKSLVAIQLGLIAMALSGAAVAAPTPPDHSSSVVRLGSGPCTGGAPELRGSGVLFRAADGASYVLTSESVVVPGDPGQKMCQWVRAWGGAPMAMPAALVRADWASGLALLKMSQEITGASPLALSDFATQPAPSGMPVLSVGYALSGALVQDKANVLLGRSDRNYLVLVPWSTELNGAHVEAGMVGGASFGGVDGKLVGVISGQYLKMREGHATRPYFWSPVAGHVEPRPILVPAAWAAQWVDQVLGAGGAAQPPIAAVRGEDRLAGKDRVRTGGLEIEAYCPAPAGSTPGGGDGTGIGGGDGSGIGGDEPDDPSCRFVMTLDTLGGTSGEHLPGVDTDEAWSRITARLHDGRKAKFVYFAQRDAVFGGLGALAVRSTAELLTSMRKGLWAPIMAYDPAPPFAASSAFAQADVALLAVDHVLNNDFFSHTMVRRSSTFVYNVLHSDYPTLLLTRDVDSLVDPNGVNGESWSYIGAGDVHRPPTAVPPKLVPYLLDRFAELKAAVARFATGAR